jgi:hypothetical protein
MEGSGIAGLWHGNGIAVKNAGLDNRIWDMTESQMRWIGMHGCQPSGDRSVTVSLPGAYTAALGL